MKTVKIPNSILVDERFRGQTVYVTGDYGEWVELRISGSVAKYRVDKETANRLMSLQKINEPKNMRISQMKLVKIKDIDNVTDLNIRGKVAHVLRTAGCGVILRIYDDNGNVIRNRSEWTLHENFVEDYDGPLTPSNHPAGKTRWDLIPWIALREVAGVFGDAAEGGKYGAHSWRTEPHPWSYYYAAAVRHVTKWWTGETRDAEDRRHSLAYAAARLLMLLELETLRPGDDDRPITLDTLKKVGDAMKKREESTDGDEDDQK